MPGEMVWRIPNAIPEWAVKDRGIPIPHIPWEKVHAWNSVTERRKLILTRVVRVTAWSLATLKNQAQPPLLNSPVKEGSNCKRQIKNIYSMWPHWQETKSHNAFPFVTSPVFQAFGTRFGFSTWPELFVGPGQGEVLSIIVWIPVFPDPPDML